MGRVLALLSILSLFLFVGTAFFFVVTLWGPQYHVTVRWDDRRTRIDAEVDAWGWEPGVVVQSHQTVDCSDSQPDQLDAIRGILRKLGPPRNSNRRMMKSPPDLLNSARMAGSGRERRTSLPAIMLGELVIPFVWIIFLLHRRWQQKRRTIMGHCPVCHYDLRASPERCPECGTPITYARGVK
jgi:hypothetical protein